MDLIIFVFFFSYLFVLAALPTVAWKVYDLVAPGKPQLIQAYEFEPPVGGAGIPLSTRLVAGAATYVI